MAGLEVNWSLCTICQDTKQENLICPANNPDKSSSGAGYKSLAEDLQDFSDIGELPSNLDHLSSGDGVEKNLLDHSAMFHKSCRAMFNKTKLQRALKRKSGGKHPIQSPKRTRASTSSQEICSGKNTCFFCDQHSPNEDLHEACTFGIDSHVRSAALKLQDTKLLGKLSAGDMVAIEAKYHRKCLVALYNRARRRENEQSSHDISDTIKHSIALAELISFIEESRLDQANTPIFKLSELAQDYCTRLEQLGVKQTQRVHTTRLKKKVIGTHPRSISTYERT